MSDLDLDLESEYDDGPQSHEEGCNCRWCLMEEEDDEPVQ